MVGDAVLIEQGRTPEAIVDVGEAHRLAEFSVEEPGVMIESTPFGLVYIPVSMFADEGLALIGRRENLMPLADDIACRIQEVFSTQDRETASVLLSGAKDPGGLPADARLQRCALVASRGSLDRLNYYVKLLAVDSRDVIVAGEYDSVSGELVRVRDLSHSF